MTTPDDAAPRNVQNVAEGASATQINHPQAPVIVGGEGNTNNFYYGVISQPQKTPSGVPYNVPRRGAIHFVGRETELETLHQQLQTAGTNTSWSRASAISAITGMGGIGKTELAVQYALKHLDLEDYPGGVCWLRAREDVGIQIVSFARSQLSLEIPEGLNLAEQVAFCWRHWQNKETLIVLDDVQEYEAIQSVLPPPRSHFKVLMTTRSQMREDAVRLLILDKLQPLAAFQLLSEILQEDARLETEQLAAEDLCEWLGYLPLGIKVVATFIKIEPDLFVQKLLSDLQAEKLQQDSITPIEAVFELSWEKLSTAEQQLTAILSLFAVAPMPWGLVDEVVQGCRVQPAARGWVQRLVSLGRRQREPEQWCELLQPKTLERARRQLVELSLLQRVGTEQYELHPLLREFFASKVGQTEHNGLKIAFTTTMIRVAQQIPQTPTLEQIQAITSVIPHLKEMAADLLKLETKDDLYLQDEDDLDWGFTGIIRFYQGQGLYAQAESWRKKCLAVVRALLGEQHLSVVTNLNSLAELYYLQGRYEEAEPLFLQALQLVQLLFDGLPPSLGGVLNNLAVLYRAQGRYEEAEPLFLQALQLQRSPMGEELLSVATSLNNLAELYRDQGQYEEAELFFLQALQLWQALFGEQHPYIATSLNNLALVYWHQERYEDAEPLFLQALELRQLLLGETHPDVAISLDNLALLYSSQGRYEEAEPLHLQALELIRLLLGETHPDVATSLNNLALLYGSQGRYEEAEPLHLQALELRRALLGDQHSAVATSLNNLALLYSSQRRYEDAESLFLQVVQLLQFLFEDQHPHIAISLNSLADLYVVQGRYEDADPLYAKALEICDRILGVAHPTSMSIRENYATCLKSMVSAFKASSSLY